MFTELANLLEQKQSALLLVGLAKHPLQKLKSASIVVRLESVLRFLLRGFTIDLRSLAAFRIGLGLMALADVLIAMSNAEVFYSDDGVYPRALLFTKQWESNGLWSLHVISGSVWFQLGLMLVQAVAAIAFIAGYRTRLANLVCWVMACSLEARNPGITNGADAVIRLLLFWSLFLPMASRWSMENAQAKARPTQETLLNFATACLLLQVAFIYGFSAVLKQWDLWFVQGKALQLALHLDAFTTPLGLWLRSQDALCVFLCRATVLLEIIGPILALLPIFRWQFRLLMAATFMVFHAGIGLSMDIGAFPGLMIVAWLAFLPSEFWNWLGRTKLAQRLGEFSSRMSDTRPVPCPAHLKSGFNPGWVTRTFAVGCLIFMFLWNMRGTNFERWEKIFPRSLNDTAFLFRLDQHWAMFAPTPMLEDGWFILKADLADGSQVDLLAEDGVLNWDKPALQSATFKDSRWQKYIMNLWMATYSQHRPWFGNYLAAKWNETHSGLSQVAAWELVFILEPTKLDGTVGETERHSLWNCQSFAGK
jgi:hypothetical protein